MNTARGTLFVLYLFSMFAVAADGAANGAEARHYLVELTEASTASADLTEVADEVARTYGGRLEIYVATGFHGFALTITPERARLLSADPRVKTIRGSDDAKSETPPTVQPVTRSAAVSQALRPATEVVPLAPITLGPYVYDAAQNITQIGTDRYQYDAMNRLQSGTAIAPGHPDNIQQFSYDGFGNLQKVVTSNAPDLYIDVDQTSNHLRDVAGTPAGTGTYTWGGGYDEAGNQLQLNGGAYRYDYDALNAMVALRNSAGRHQFYLYDANGERLATIDYGDASNATWHYAVRDLQGRVVRTLTNAIAGGVSTWQWKSDNIYRDSSLLASVQSNGLTSSVSHYHLDHLGSPLLITNEAHEKTAQYRFWPFGGEAPGSTVDTQPMKFTGHERDSDGSVSALDYMHARYYSSLMGRLLSVDKSQWGQLQFGSESDQQRFRAMLGQPQNWNRYSYVRNNPMNLTDPTGNDACKVDGKEIQCRVVVVYDQKTNRGTIYLIGKVGKTEKILLQGKVVVGENGKTPTGTFHALRWEKDHTSTLYGSQANTPWSKSPLGLNAFGPFQLHIKELEARGIWIHGTMGPGWVGSSELNYLVSPASHGCVRCANPTIISLHEMMPAPRGNQITISTDPGDAPDH